MKNIVWNLPISCIYYIEPGEWFLVNIRIKKEVMHDTAETFQCAVLYVQYSGQ
jgi:hypothetical protein